MQLMAKEVAVEARVAAAVAKVVAAVVGKEAVEAVTRVVVREMVEDGLPAVAIPLEEAVLITLLPSSHHHQCSLAVVESERGMSRQDLKDMSNLHH